MKKFFIYLFILLFLITSVLLLLYYFSKKPEKQILDTYKNIVEKQIYPTGEIDMFGQAQTTTNFPKTSSNGTPEPTSNNKPSVVQIGGYIEKINENNVVIKIDKSKDETKIINFPVEGVVFLKAVFSEDKTEQKTLNATNEDKTNYYKVGNYIQLTVNQIPREDGNVNNFATMILLYPEQPKN